MKLTQIEIKSFGKFHDRQFDLSKPLTVFYGLNEAGKSTLVSFIGQIIFGFATKKSSQKNYQLKNTPESFGGSLTFIQDESIWKLERILGTGLKTGTLTVWLNGEEAPAESFMNQIKNIDADFFAESFLYNQDTLGRILTLSEQELINQINYLGASNSSKWMDLSKNLSKDSEKLFKPSKTAKNPAVNQKIIQLKELETKLAEKNLQYQTYQENAIKIQPYAEKITALEKQNNELTNKSVKLKQRLQQLQIFKQYEATKIQIDPDLTFNEADYRDANLISNQIENISQKVKQDELNLTEDDQVNTIDSKKVDDLIDRWSNLKPLDTQISDKNRQIEELENDQNRIRNYQKDTVKLADFSETEKQEFVNDFKTYQAETKKIAQVQTSPEKKSGITNVLQISGIVLVLVGIYLLLTDTDKTTALLFISSGTIFTALPTLQAKKSAPNATEKTTENNNPDQKFKAKYEIDPPVDLSELLIRADKFKETNDKIFNLHLEIDTAKDKIAEFAHELGISTADASLNIKHEVQQQINLLKQQVDEQFKRDTQAELVKKDLDQAKADLQTQKQKLEILLLQNKVEDLAEFKERADLFAKQKDLENKLQVYRENLGEDLAYFKENQLDEEKLSQQISATTQQQGEVQLKLHHEQQAIADLNSQQQMLASDSDVQELEQAIADQRDEIKTLVNQWLVKKMGAEWIDEMLNLASSNRFPKMKEGAQEYFTLLSGNRYSKINLTDKKITVVRDVDKEKFTVDQLSRGTAEQLYFALKLAFVEQITDEISLPILIDDAFVNFDGQRVQYMKELLDKLASKNQVLVFTARDDLADLFTNEDNLIRL